MTVTMTGFDHQVAWREFSRVAQRPNQTEEWAEVVAHTNVQYDFVEDDEGWRVTGARGTVSVNEAASWVVQGKETAALLRHEQGHFDITALGVREEANLVNAITGTSASNIQTQRDEVRQQIQTKINDANDRYDTRTDHSQNAAAQSRWLRSISAAKNKDAGTIDDLPA